MAKRTPPGNSRIHTAPPYSISTKAAGSKGKRITQTEEKERDSTKKQMARKESQDTTMMTKKEKKTMAKMTMSTESTPMKMKFANDPFATLEWWDYYTKELTQLTFPEKAVGLVPQCLSHKGTQKSTKRTTHGGHFSQSNPPTSQPQHHAWISTPHRKALHQQPFDSGTEQPEHGSNYQTMSAVTQTCHGDTPEPTKTVD
jgi:hypothetical protein